MTTLLLLFALVSWDQYLGGADSPQYSSLKQITKANVKQLQVAWTYQTGGNSLLFDPLVVDGTMYIAKPGMQGTSMIVALDATTGKELWTHTNQGGVSSRGMNYWESKDRKDRRLVYINSGFITEISTLTGETIQSFGDNGRVDPSLGDRHVTRPANNPGRITKTRSSFRCRRAGQATTPRPVTFMPTT
jgi:quinoprotein glucose dehydrogenase